MSTAQILYEQYKVLPPRLQRELKQLINEDEGDQKVPLVEQIREGMKEVRLIQAGKLKAKTLREVLDELDNES